MDSVHRWLIDHIERFAGAADAPGCMTLLGPGGLTLDVEVDALDGDGSGMYCQVADIKVRVEGKPAGNFAYAVSDRRVVSLIGELAPEIAPRVGATILPGCGAEPGMNRRELTNGCAFTTFQPTGPMPTERPMVQSRGLPR